jgi:Protein of unknown function (DUF4254)
MKLLRSEAIVNYHDHCLTNPGWPPQIGINERDSMLLGIVVCIAENHRLNGLMWNHENLACRKTVPDHEIVLNKRAIDTCNQARNDAIERIDEILLAMLDSLTLKSNPIRAPYFKPSNQARLNSETAGSMIDRMSILALKICAMEQQTLREDASFAHRYTCHVKHEHLKRQRRDLACCFDELLQSATTGAAKFQVYRQFKMYNDPELNPALLSEKTLGTFAK